ncbi:MAG: putative ABC transporter permease [Lachnospiraceae bacterium]|nr:putative ABC transporter permease [Lachnospiraceae bacterium]
MWTKELFGTDVYHLVGAFIIYSMLGWLVESIYMSICNKKITNRGFGRGPFCPIYGFGAVFGYLILRPLTGQYVKLYFAGAILATVFEFLVGKLMIRVLGSLWWDYNDKPLNYKGIICLESTLAWGCYALIVFGFLNRKIVNTLDLEGDRFGDTAVQRVCIFVLLMAVMDYLYRFYDLYRKRHEKEEAPAESDMEELFVNDGPEELFADEKRKEIGQRVSD